MSIGQYPRYTATGVEWMPTVPDHWGVERLKACARLRTDKATERTNAVGLENVESWTGRFLPSETEFSGDGIGFSTDDLLFGKLRPYLAKVLIAPFDGEAVGDFLVLAPADKMVARFLQYRMLTREFIEIVDGSTFGSKMPRADWDFVGGMPVAVPPICEQRAIVEFLDRETAKIDVLVAEQEALIELLREKRRAVISMAVSKGVRPDAPLKASGIAWLGDIPAHWRVLRLRRVLATVDYGISDALSSEGEIAVLRMGNIKNGAVVMDYLKYADAVPTELLLSSGDLLYNRTNSLDQIAKVGRFTAHDSTAVSFASYLVRLRTNSAADSRFLSLVLNTDGVLGHARAEAFVAIGQCNLNPSRYGEISIPVPPIDEQMAIVDHVEDIVRRVDALMTSASSAVHLLSERRSALLSAAITGQIDVRHLPAAAV